MLLVAFAEPWAEESHNFEALNHSKGCGREGETCTINAETKPGWRW